MSMSFTQFVQRVTRAARRFVITRRHPFEDKIPQNSTATVTLTTTNVFLSHIKRLCNDPLMNESDVSGCAYSVPARLGKGQGTK